MLLNKLTLQNFRFHRTLKSFDFGGQKTYIAGPNAHGKTTLLEAIYFLTRTHGFRAAHEVELATFGATHGFVEGEFEGEGGDVQTSAINFAVVDEKLVKKLFLQKTPITGPKYRAAQTPCVLFAPEQLDIVTHSPSVRREYLNSTLSQLSPTYAKAAKSYELALRRRNALLADYTTLEQLKAQIIYWDNLVVENGQIIQDARASYIATLNAHMQCADKFFKVIYIPSLINRELLEAKFATESQARRTLIGPQRDDFEILFTGQHLVGSGGDLEPDATSFRPVARYGSRSEQRLAMLHLKLKEIDNIQKTLGTSPILLLDDIFSEFDHVHHSLLQRVIPNFQTILTTVLETDELNLSSSDGLIEL